MKALAPQHPEWKDKEPFASLLKGDLKGALAGGEKAMLEIVMATHAGMTTEEFEKIVQDWIATAKHPETERLYTEMVYQPMLELLAYLRANGFKTFIVSGGGIEFMRPWTEKVYGIPPEQVVGSSGKTQVRAARRQARARASCRRSTSSTTRTGKPVGIQHAHRPPARSPPSATPTATCRCSNGRPPAAARASWLHRPSHRRRARVGLRPRLARSASSTRRSTRRTAKGWTVVSMKDDWKTHLPVREVVEAGCT